MEARSGESLDAPISGMGLELREGKRVSVAHHGSGVSLINEDTCHRKLLPRKSGWH